MEKDIFNVEMLNFHLSQIITTFNITKTPDHKFILPNLHPPPLINFLLRHCEVGIVFQWENEIYVHPFPSIMPLVLKFRERFVSLRSKIYTLSVSVYFCVCLRYKYIYIYTHTHTQV